MAADHPEVVERGLRAKRAGNRLIETIGGRPIHPVNVRVGGFYRLPTREELGALRPQLLQARDEAVATVRLVSQFDFPDFEQPYEYVALRSPHGYPLEGGTAVSSTGRELSTAELGDVIVEDHVARSNALHARLDGRTPYVVGPLARFSLNRDALNPIARDCADEAGLGAECRNPFQSIVVRSVELVHAIDEALRIIDGWRGADAPAVPVPARAGVGHGVTEAPRGMLYHRYELGADGTILDATIVPPTSQNQLSIEADLRTFVQARLDLPHDELVRQCELAIRNYDPCISCATHFLDLTVERR
jgi:coenzyme F420-reducing hydrogenase alpha subunit